MRAYRITLSLLLISTFYGCDAVNLAGGRAKELRNMPVLYESYVVAANPGDPHMRNHLSTFNDVYSSLMSKKKTDQFIPDELMAYPKRMAKYYKRNKGMDVRATIEVGDRVKVLAFKQNKAAERFGLVKTQYGTFAWIADWHLNDENGKRLNVFRHR